MDIDGNYDGGECKLLLKRRPLIIFVVALLLVSLSYVNLIVPKVDLILQLGFASLIELGWLCLGLWGIYMDRGLRIPGLGQVGAAGGVILIGMFAYAVTSVGAVVGHLVSLYSLLSVIRGFVSIPNLVMLVIVAPSEETLFRGYFYRHWRRLGFWKAAIFSSLLFTAVHIFTSLHQAGPLVNIHAVLTLIGLLGYKFVIGICFSACYELSGNLLYPIILHGLLDSSPSGIVLMADYPLMMVIYLCVSLLFALVFKLTLRRARSSSQDLLHHGT